ncbi:MAG: Amuc_1100 family pilus-like protein [Methylacidiphilales bacterium]|nr:Amuc_1100 family pilus-like protein [Candidatus Methylacidiphilales bacterium]
MAWIKRNLVFVIISVLAVGLMGMAGWYLFSKWSLNNSILTDLNEQYTQLKTLNEKKPNPGEPGKVDNVKAAKEQQEDLRKFMGRTHDYLQRIPRIPDLPKVSDQDFSSALSLTIDQMQHAASNASVILPASQYKFSFQAEASRVSFTPGTLVPLSVQLGEVKAIIDVLFDAKVNSLDGVRRERISPDDTSGPETDYLDQRSVTNALAVLTPYEVTFRGFSAELAAVLAGYASSPYGLVVKTINVEAAPAVATDVTATENPTMGRIYAPPQPIAPAPRPMSAEQRYEERYGPPRTNPNMRPAPLRVEPVASSVPAPAVRKGGLPTVLDEKQLKITLFIEVVKMQAPNPK